METFCLKTYQTTQALHGRKKSSCPPSFDWHLMGVTYNHTPPYSARTVLFLQWETRVLTQAILLINTAFQSKLSMCLETCDLGPLNGCETRDGLMYCTMWTPIKNTVAFLQLSNAGWRFTFRFLIGWFQSGHFLGFFVANNYDGCEKWNHWLELQSLHVYERCNTLKTALFC